MAESDSPHELNGHAVKEKRKSRPKKDKPPVEGKNRVKECEDSKKEKCGRAASEVPVEKVAYLVKPWVPFNCLTLVAGQPGCGKSSFAAWLAEKAGCLAILPGSEERVAMSTVPRLKANGVNLRNVLLLDDRDYRLPNDKLRIANALKEWGATLLIVDPIDSYMEDGKSENAAQDVREFLEAFQWIAEQAEAAVVGVRHPGKDAKNIMPGSRAWRAVPRSIVMLTADASWPPKRFIVHDKDSHGNECKPHRYALDGVPGQPRQFVLAGEVEAAIVSLSREVSDPTERVEVRKAGMYARRLFESSPEPLVKDWKTECATNGVSDKSRRDAYRLLNLKEKPGGVGGNWIMIRTEKEWPSWTDWKGLEA